MANEIEQLKGITALATLRDVKAHLDVALADYALRIGAPVDAIDYEHLKMAQRILDLLLEANRG
jgi:hypothetical protein